MKLIVFSLLLSVFAQSCQKNSSSGSSAQVEKKKPAAPRRILEETEAQTRAEVLSVTQNLNESEKYEITSELLAELEGEIQLTEEERKLLDLTL